MIDDAFQIATSQQGAAPTSFRVQHLIDPCVCIRCNTCEETCPKSAISHDDNNYVVDADLCNHCKACVAPCPTGAVDCWQKVINPYSLASQLSWTDLPEPITSVRANPKAVSDQLHNSFITTPIVQVFGRSDPAVATVITNQPATRSKAHEVRHIVLDFGTQSMPIMEGQSIGILAPGVDHRGLAHIERLYSVASARGGEVEGTNTFALTVKRITSGTCSNYLCNARVGDKVRVVGPFGATFLLPQNPQANLLMVCTGTGVAPFRGFLQQRLRSMRDAQGELMMFYGGRTAKELPYFGRQESLPAGFLDHHICFSREPGLPRLYVQDRMRVSSDRIQKMLMAPETHIFICGRKGLETGVEDAIDDILKNCGSPWLHQREVMQKQGRFHVETY